MQDDTHMAISAALSRLLRPLVRVLLRLGIPFGVFADLTKQAYVDLAITEFGLPGRKPSVSRAAILTGLTRKEISRIQKLPRVADVTIREQYNRAARVISGWISDPDFLDKKGDTVGLPFDGDGKTFAELVRVHSGDIPPRAILDELERVGAIEQHDNGTLHLVVRSYVPSRDSSEKIKILGTDTAYLIDTISYNLENESTSRFQQKVAYDNLPEEAIPEFKEFVRRRGQHMLEEFNQWLAERDRDVNENVAGTGRMEAGVGIYYFEEDLNEDAGND